MERDLVFISTLVFLRDLGEIYWFRGENEDSKGNKARGEVYRGKYAEVHALIREVEAIREADRINFA